MNKNIYETPKSEVTPAAEAAITNVYSPNQILGGSFWGGPIAAVYFLWKNYLALGKVEYAEKTLIIGSFFVIAILGGLPFLPESFPNMVIPIAYSFAAKQLAVTTQLEKSQIQDDENYLFHSNWRVFGISTLTLLLLFTVAVVVMFTMDSFGIISLA